MGCGGEGGWRVVVVNGGCKWWKVWGKKGVRNQGDPNLAVIKAGGPWKWPESSLFGELGAFESTSVVHTLISEV